METLLLVLARGRVPITAFFLDTAGPGRAFEVVPVGVALAAGLTVATLVAGLAVAVALAVALAVGPCCCFCRWALQWLYWRWRLLGGRCAGFGPLGARRICQQEDSGTRTAGGGGDFLSVKRAVPKGFLHPPAGRYAFGGSQRLGVRGDSLVHGSEMLALSLTAVTSNPGSKPQATTPSKIRPPRPNGHT